MAEFIETVLKAEGELTAYSVVSIRSCFHDHAYLWKDLRFLPACFCAVSFVIILLTALAFVPAIRRNLSKYISYPSNNQEDPSTEYTARQKFKAHIRSHGGSFAYTLRALKLVGCIVLLALSVIAVLLFGRADAEEVGLGAIYDAETSLTCDAYPEIALTIAYTYVTLLAALYLLPVPVLGRVCNIHATFVLLTLFVIFCWRNILPLAMFGGRSADDKISWLLWPRGALILIVGVLLPLLTPRIYQPVDASNPAKVPNPEQTASVLSFLFFSFLDPVIFTAYLLPRLPYEELPPLADYDCAKNLAARSLDHLDSLRRRQKGLKDRHFFFGLMAVFWKNCVSMTAYKVLGVFTKLLLPIGVNRLLTYLQTDGEGAVVRPWVWISFLFLAPVFGTFWTNLYLFTSARMTVQLEALITESVFRHALKVRMVDDDAQPDIRVSATSLSGSEPENSKVEESKTPHLVGRINSLISIDLANITSALNLTDILIVPLQLACSVLFLYLVLGWAAIVGMALMVVGFPVSNKIGQLLNTTVKERMKKTDARVQAVTESMNILRMVKMFGWEEKIKDHISEKRDEELAVIKRYRLLVLVILTVNFMIPLCTMVATFAFFTLYMRQELTAARVFSSMILFDSLREQLYACVVLIPMFITAKVSLDRVTKFLQNTPLLDKFKATVAEDSDRDHRDVVGFHNAVFRWTDSGERTQHPRHRDFRLYIDDVVFKPRTINLVVGPTGSGKTSILMALLGEMRFQPSGPDSWFNLPRSQGVSYSAQESWLLNETIKNNILFGEPYEEERFKKVIHQCCLEQDLSLFDAGSDTEVGEKGLTLSGGQKARVTLARAIYSPAGIVLLDDVLSALDVHTARWIVEKCLCGDLIKGRTVILVTHNVALAAPIAGNIISIDIDGRVVSQDAIPQTLLAESQVAVQSEEAATTLDFTKSDTLNGGTATKNVSGQLVIAEERAEGRVSWKAFKIFVEAFGGPIFWIVIILGIFLCHFCDILDIWWLGAWASAYEGSSPNEVNVRYYLGVYVLLLLSSNLLFAISYATFVYGGIRTSRRLHTRLRDSVLGSTLRWLDTNPIGRVISRFTQDIRQVDSSLCDQLFSLVQQTLERGMQLGAVVVISPIFVVPGMALAAIGIWLGRVYIHAQLSIKRDMSNTRSPIYSYFAAAISSLISIRAYGAEQSSEDEMRQKIDKYSRPARTYYNLNRWIGVRSDILGGVFATSLAIYLVYYRRDVGAGTTGYSLDMAVAFSAGIVGWVRSWNEFEISGNSLERILDYLVIEQEPAPTESGKPPAYWPASGTIEAENLSAKYSEDGPSVLKNISFIIKSGERVGIVGRTGSGKSSLALSLIRMIPTTGLVRFDGRPTHETNLDALRSNLTIIPQDPTLMAGTLRSNLDPFTQYNDAILNDALRAAGLFRLQREDSESRITLDTSVSGSGSNFSVGQRQIVALARAIVRNAKVLILDEATASVDAETDNAIQTSIRTELKHATLITIAHRLQTIADYDKIMVLDSGKLVEFDTPLALLGKKDSLFRALVDESSDRDQLWAAAKKGRAMPV